MRLALLFVSILSLNACTHVKLYDDPWCLDAGKHGAECFNTFSEEEFSLNKYEWDKLRVGQACTATRKPAEGYLHIKVPLEKLCADTNVCTVEEKKALESVSKKMDAAMEKTSNSDPFDNGVSAPRESE